MKKILAIDDQKDNLTTIMAVIKSNIPNCQVVTAQSGEEGILLAQKESPDTILLDIIMPGMDGFEVCKKIKADEKTKHIPIVILTAVRSDSENRVKSFNCGADAFLSKPIEAVELVAQVNVMLRIKEAEDKLRNENELLENQVLERTQKLLESEEKHRALYNNAPLPYQSLNEDGNIIDVNPAWLQLLGYKTDEVIGNWYGNFLHPDSKTLFEKSFPSLKTCGQVNDVPFKIRHKNGHYLEISLNGMSGYFPDGKFKQTYCVFQDVTKRKQAEDKLHRNRYYLAKAQEIGVIGTWELDIPKNILRWTEENYKIFGIPAGTDINFDLFIKCIHPLDRDFVVGKWSEALKSGEYDIEHRILVNNEIKWVREKADFEYGDNVEPLIAIGFTQDITKRKRAEQIQKVLFNIAKAVITEEKLYDLILLIRNELSTIIDTTNFHVALYDAKTDAISLPFFSNNKVDGKAIPTGNTLTRYLINKKRPLFITKDDLEPLRELGEIRTFEADPEVWLGVPMFIEGNLIGAFVLQSYTNRNAYNKSDMEMLEFVSDQISQSIYRKKTEEDLLRALEKATESDRLKSAFLANMSHEIRTPMNGILGFSDLLKQPGLSGDQQLKFIEIIEKSGQRMLNIINDLIDISKIEAGQTKLYITELNVNKQIEYIYTFFKPEAEKKGLKLSFQTSQKESDAVVQSDKEKVYAILTNLVKNAIKYTFKGSIEFGYTKENDYLRFFVSDTGIGIPPERLNAVFNRFVQADIEDRQALEGAGLGLAISKAYVEMLGGKIWVESELDKGSIFYFNIPINEKKIAKESVEILPENSTFKKRIGNLKILIAEDDATTRLYFEQLFKNNFKQLLFSQTGTETVQICRDNPDIDLILMDIKMPGISGYTATQQIREFNKKVIIIAQTAFAISGDRERALEAGCNDYISKPIQKNVLLEKIGKLFYENMDA